MNWFNTASFRHGTHPPEEKDETNHIPIRRFPFAPVMLIPLAARVGPPAIPVVREGEEVARGQIIARPEHWLSVASHAPVDGVIKKIDLVPTINGQMVPGIYLKSLPGSTQEVAEGKPCRVDSATPDEIIEAIQQAGIVGLGGAAFPTHVKLKIPANKFVDTLILNGVECEPYLTTDHRVMLEQTDDIFTGIAYLLKVTGATKAIIGVEANKPDAALALRTANKQTDIIAVETLRVKYPQGAEKMLISALLGRAVPSGGLPLDAHVVVINVATAAEIGRLLPHGRGILERVITIGGPAVTKKGNYRIPIGTPLRFALETVGVKDDIDLVFLGGPMMGQAVPSLDIPITKGTSGFVAFTQQQTRTTRHVYPCIRCGYCVEACPMLLNPAQLGLLAKNEQFELMRDKFHLQDCFECGACSYVCPSHIPLVQYFRLAKAELSKTKAELSKTKAELSKTKAELSKTKAA